MSQQKTNNQVILSNLLTKDQKENFPTLNSSEHFEVYSAGQILKDYDLSDDDINYGIVDGSRDGGVDSIYTFLNGEIIKEDTEINPRQSNNHIDLIIIQSKLSTSFSEEPIRKLIEFSKCLLDLSLTEEQIKQKFSSFYNQRIIEKTNLFKQTYLKTSQKFPSLSIKYFYISTGEKKYIHSNVKTIQTLLSETLIDLFGNANFSFEFIGATELLALARKRPISSKELEVAESPIGTSSGSYLCLVTLPKYFEFITDESGKLSKNIFESNVRDYQGSVLVNEGIKKTLENQKSDNFWYLNNGVTIITPKATLSGKKLIIEDPQIVNGLQTSNEIYLHFSQNQNEEEKKTDTRTILIRVICEENESSRDRIIKATNSQTSIPPASLRSSDEIHRNIEDFFKQEDFFYDRRKNFYKNIGKPIYKIVSISYLAQAMMAIYLHQPNDARARPSTLLNNDDEYEKIFGPNISMNVYLNVLKIMKNVENFLKNQDIDTTKRNDIKFYVAMILGIKISKTKDLIKLQKKLSEIQIIDTNNDQIILIDCLNFVKERYEKLGGTDAIAKGRDLLNLLLKDIKTIL